MFGKNNKILKSIIPRPLRPTLARLYRYYYRYPRLAISNRPFGPSGGEDGIWLVVDYPKEKEVSIQAGVLSIRGWAWSTQYGRGKLWLSIETSKGTIGVIPIPHRIVRADVSQIFPDIPSDNYAGFEVSIDRFDLPENSTVYLYFGTADTVLRIYDLEITASHKNRLVGSIKMRCNNCRSTRFKEIGKKDHLTLVQCKRCGLVFTNPRPKQEIIHQRYSQEYFEHEYLNVIASNREAHENHWNNILNLVDQFKMVSPYLFEIGTGAGYLLDLANQRGWKTSGIDVNESAVAFAHHQLGLDVSIGDVQTWQFPEDKFGAILLESTLEHFIDPFLVITKCARALHPGGGLFIWTLGNEGDYFKTQGMDYGFVGPAEHLYYFPASVLCRMCESVGLRVNSLWREESYDSVALLASRRNDLFEPGESSKVLIQILNFLLRSSRGG